MQMGVARVVAIGLCLAGLSAAPALAQRKAAGVEAGIGLSRVSPDAAGESVSRGPGLLAGAYVQLPVFSTVGLQVELVYVQKNSHLTSTTDMKLDYVEVPILAKLKLVKTIYLVEGVSLGFPVRARLSHSSGADQDIKDEIASPDISMVIGGGIPFRKFAIEGRYEGGFKIVETSATAPIQRSRTLSLLARVHF
jgi:hypothetical protein